VRERLAHLTSFSGGRERALGLMPTSELHHVLRSHAEWQEVKTLLELRPNFSLGGVHDVTAIAEQGQIGGLLTPEQLMDVRSTIAGSRNLRETLLRLQGRLPIWQKALGDLPDCGDVEDEVSRCIGARGEVLDQASDTLQRLRLNVRQAHDRLTTRLNELLTSSRVRTVLQDPIITLRSGRYVVPVKADFRGEFQGIVHDVSASGATLFMEPLDTINLGNAWRQLQIEEEREVERVLRVLSELVGDYASEIRQTVALLAHFDLALAKARYALQIRGIAPVTVSLASSAAATAPTAGREERGGAYLFLKDARHPLLTGAVVPMTLNLDAGQRALVITGPNTGGKTVALKTVGILVLMNQAGMPVPVREESRFPLYAEVFADIGDEQSIEQSLSTFSSHMTNIIRILGQAKEDCLVLLDELGAGTDPIEGSALGRALLLHLLERNVTTIATTHHSDLKAFAHNTPGVQNASVEFDAETLAPTYRLIIGLPGRSNAIAIAERLGLPSALVERAKALLEPEGLAVEALLTQLQQERDAMTRLRTQTEVELHEAQALREQLAVQRQRLEEEGDSARAEAARELTLEAETLRRELARASKDIQRASQEQRREELVEASKTLEQAEKELATPRWRPPRRDATGGPTAPLRLAAGLRVWVKGLEQTAEVVALPEQGEEDVEVQIGVFRAKVKQDQLESLNGAVVPAQQPRRTSWAFATTPGEEVEPELHLRGQRVEAALGRLEEYLDLAFRASLPWVRIVHGKGTGVMRRAVREVLAKHPLVRAFETAPQEQGGEGVTVAHLNQ